MKEERIGWVDIAKGIGIILIVVGHIFASQKANGVVYLFHLPLFFFLSGFLYRKTDIVKYIKKKALHILLPYVSFFVVLAFFVTFFIADEIPPIQKYIDGFITGRPGNLFYDISPLWFLPCLFLTQVIYNIFKNVLSERKMHIACLTIFFLSLLMNIYNWSNITFWSLSILLLSIPLFHLGHLYRNINLKRYDIAFWILGAFAVLSPLILNKSTILLYTGNFGIPVLTVVLSVASIIFVIKVSQFVERFSVMSETLSRLGTASLTIMALHLPLWFALMKILNEDSPLTKFSSLLFVIAAIALSYILYLFINRYKITQLLFLGINNPIKQLKEK